MKAIPCGRKILALPAEEWHCCTELFIQHCFYRIDQVNQAMTKILTHTACPLIITGRNDYNSQHGKTFSQSIVGELPR
jgi:hypothetical protein